MRENRKTTSGAKSFENNVGADERVSVRVKNKGGAPKGNCNALKHGRTTAEMLGLRRRIRAHRRYCRMMVRMVEEGLKPSPPVPNN